MQIIFDTYGKLTGAQIKTFLLEKVRVVKHSAMERNYHIFYMLAAGASPEERELWSLGDLRSHQFTSQSGCYDRRDGVLDADLYGELIEAFAVMGFEEEEKVYYAVWWLSSGGFNTVTVCTLRWYRQLFLFSVMENRYCSRVWWNQVVVCSCA